MSTPPSAPISHLLKGKVGKQIVLPWTKAIEIAKESMRVRLGRSVITAASVILATAFFAFTMADHEFMARMIALADPNINFLLQKRGIDLETGDPGLKAREWWLLLSSMAVCLVGVSNALLMSVTERIKEIGTMKCLGALNSFVVKLFLIEALFMGSVSSLAGVLVGEGGALAVNWAGFGSPALVHAPVAGLLRSLVITVVTGTVLSVMAAIYPSLVAARMQPVEAMRSEI